MFIRQRNFLRQVMHKYKCTNANAQMQMHKCKCTNTNINIIEIHVPGKYNKEDHI